MGYHCWFDKVGMEVVLLRRGIYIERLELVIHLLCCVGFRKSFLLAETRALIIIFFLVEIFMHRLGSESITSSVTMLSSSSASTFTTTSNLFIPRRFLTIL